jgi:hypothetical protein
MISAMFFPLHPALSSPSVYIRGIHLHPGVVHVRVLDPRFHGSGDKTPLLFHGVANRLPRFHWQTLLTGLVGPLDLTLSTSKMESVSLIKVQN